MENNRTFDRGEKFWCPICPKCKEALPTNHSRCKCYTTPRLVGEDKN